MKRLKKILLWLFSIVLLALCGMVYFSHYKSYEGYDYKLIKNSVTINAPAHTVYHYLGNSANAQQWSVFVDHITPLNIDSVPDGQIGSIRRAYCQADELGMRWDELTTQVYPDSIRQLITFNYINFVISSEGLATEQLYTKLDSATCQLTFTLHYLNHEPTFTEVLKTHFASYTITDIFDRNLANIKRIVETSK